MSVSRDLQDVLSRVNEAQAGGRTYGKTELGGLVRELRLIRDEALEHERTLEKAIADLRSAADSIEELRVGPDFVRVPILGMVD